METPGGDSLNLFWETPSGDSLRLNLFRETSGGDSLRLNEAELNQLIGKHSS